MFKVGDKVECSSESCSCGLKGTVLFISSTGLARIEYDPSELPRLVFAETIRLVSQPKEIKRNLPEWF